MSSSFLKSIKLNKEAKKLSVGEKQRVCINRVINQNASVILADEPTASLDKEYKKEVMDELINACKNKILIVVTHDLDLAGLSDRIIVMKEGNIISEGKPEEIFKERHMLKSSNLDMPFGLRMYDEASKIEKLKNNEQLMEALWEYHLKA
jgi:energy-coupling factor transport system ATP-binding protein